MALSAFSYATDDIEGTCACFVAMPYKRLFTQADPVLGLQKYNTGSSNMRGKASNRPRDGRGGPIVETIAGIEKERPKSRERSKTLDIVSKWYRDGASLNDQDFSRKVNFSSQPNTRPVIHQSKTKPRNGAASKVLETESMGRTVLYTDGTPTDGKRRKSEAPERLKQTTDSWRSRTDFSEGVKGPVSSTRKRPLSVPPDPGQKISISAIVKARNMAMKWRGKNGRMGRRHTVLPTIADDSTKFSLCANVKCSPQFEAVIKLLEGDEEVDDADKSFKLMSVK